MTLPIWRQSIRSGQWQRPTAGLAPGYVQANLVILPKSYADEFYEFTQKNPKPAPLLERTMPGDPTPHTYAPTADLRTDVPKYRIFQKGILQAEVTDITSLWQDDFVSFLLGCSFTFEMALQAAKIPVRHIDENKNVPMYATNLSCDASGRFSGPMVVSMRPIPKERLAEVHKITAQYPLSHGEPVHIGDPAYLGIKDLYKPDFGDAVPIKDGEVPVFWACGVTPQLTLREAAPMLAITHAPGHMFITDMKENEVDA